LGSLIINVSGKKFDKLEAINRRITDKWKNNDLQNIAEKTKDRATRILLKRG
jgi:hypothetical protein